MSNRLRLVALALFGSLAVNLFLGGLMIGRWLDPRHPRPHAERGGPEGSAPGWMRRALGPEGAVTLEEAWRAHAPAIEPLREELRRSREAVTVALEAQPFDQTAYAAALAEMQANMTNLYAAIHTVMVDVVGRLTPEQRHAMVERSRERERHKAERRD